MIILIPLLLLTTTKTTTTIVMSIVISPTNTINQKKMETNSHCKVSLFPQCAAHPLLSSFLHRAVFSSRSVSFSLFLSPFPCPHVSVVSQFSAFCPDFPPLLLLLGVPPPVLHHHVLFSCLHVSIFFLYITLFLCYFLFLSHVSSFSSFVENSSAWNITGSSNSPSSGLAFSSTFLS